MNKHIHFSITISRYDNLYNAHFFNAIKKYSASLTYTPGGSIAFNEPNYCRGFQDFSNAEQEFVLKSTRQISEIIRNLNNLDKKEKEKEKEKLMYHNVRDSKGRFCKKSTLKRDAKGRFCK